MPLPEPTPSPQARRVVDRFLVDGRLVAMPAKAGKRRLVLEDIVQAFETGVSYSELAVNEILSSFHPDYCTLRRYLVDECLLDRRNGQYWRFDRETMTRS